jgi:hypothetical protein
VETNLKLATLWYNINTKKQGVGMSWFSNIFTSENVANGLDKLVLTAEERLDFHKELMKAYEPFKLIQRFLSMVVSLLFVFIVVVEVTLAILTGQYDWAYTMLSNIQDLEIVNMVGYSFMTIMSLYFTGGVINTFVKGKR